MNLASWSRQQVHLSYLLASFALGVCLGLVLVKVAGLHVGWGWLVVGLALAVGAMRNRRLLAAFFILLAGVLVGGQRGGYFVGQASYYQPLFEQTAVIRGVVVEDPEAKNSRVTKLQLGSVEVGDRELPGRIYVVASHADRVKRGDLVTVKGDVDKGFGSFQAVLRRAEVLRVQRGPGAIREARQSFAAGVERVAEPNEAALGLGFVVGQKSNLPDELEHSLQVVGLVHIVVASGYNLTILVRFARRLFSRWSRFLATSVSGVLMFAFALFSGFSPSMNRAVLVTGLSLLAWHYGRRFHPLLLLIYVAAITAYWKPPYIWGDIGWYLSFLAFGGVLILAPLISRLVLRTSQPSAVVQVVIETLSAQIMALPLILLVFGQLPSLALVANALVAPIIPISMLLTTIAGLIGMFVPWLGWLGGLLMHYSVGYVLAVVDWLSAVPGAQVAVQLSAFGLAVVYAVVIGLTGLVWWWTKHDFRARSVVE